jgi:S-methylmethionine-dependent homocysteine/selenocysteine methylase/SAM-dependent methyltransferase
MEARTATAYELIDSAIRSNRCVILDGGIATELPHRRGQDRERLWGLEALTSAPDDVADVHRRYIDAGVDVLTTNTWALPTLAMGSESDPPTQSPGVHWMEIARRGLRVARQAIAESERDGEVAVAFALNGDLDGPDGLETVALLQRTLASEPPDLLLLETLSLLRPSLFDLVAALVESGLPLWLSFRRCRHGLCGVYGQHWGGPEGDAFGKAARRFEDMGVAALLVNCIPPDHVDGMVSYLRDFTDLPLGVYPNLGYYTSAGWQTESEIGGDEYAEMAARWRQEGAQIVGGCCGTRPEHLRAARESLAGTVPGVTAPAEPSNDVQGRAGPDVPSALSWQDRRGRSLYPLPVPTLTRHEEATSRIPGSYLLWRYLFETSTGAHQRCLDIGCGVGLQTVQLALNGATHVHAIDVDELAVSSTLANAFRNNVAERVSGEVADLYPWVPGERYEAIVACLPQIPSEPLTGLSSHRRTDYWGRGLVDQVINKLPGALATEGVALLTLTSVLSGQRTLEQLAEVGLEAEIVSWELADLPDLDASQRSHLETITSLSDAFTVDVAGQSALVTYLLQIRHRVDDSANARPPWLRRH